MKTTIALLLLLSIPCEILSFSAQSTTTAAIQRRETTRNKFIFKAADDNKSDVGLLEPQQPVATDSPTETNGAKADEECILAEEEELTETQKLLKKVKQAGTAGAISYAAWELAFWGVSIPVCVVGYRELTGHWPDFSNAEDMQKVGAEAFAFVNFARLAVPLRIGLALSTTPWVEENIVKKFKKDDQCAEE